MKGVAVLVLSCLVCVGSGVVLTARATRLRALREWALVSERMHSVGEDLSFVDRPRQGRSEDAGFDADGLEASVGRLVGALRESRELKVGPVLTSQGLGVLGKQASALKEHLDESLEELLALEDAQDHQGERARATFEQLDGNGDALVSLEDILNAATEILSSEQKAKLEARFRAADADGSGELDFLEFESYWKTQQLDDDRELAEALARRSGDLETLLDLSLEISSAQLDHRLADGALPVGGPGAKALGGGKLNSPTALSPLVDTWCDLAHRRAALPCASILVADARGAVAAREELLADAGALSSDLNLNNLGTAAPPSVQRKARDAGKKAKSMFGFVGRGLKILGADVARAGRLATKGLRKRGKLDKEEGDHLKRTVTDVLTLVPYSAIMAIPLSPPGHVFAFTCLQKMGAPVPSSFTAQRQEVGRFYDAALAKGAPQKATPPSDADAASA